MARYSDCSSAVQDITHNLLGENLLGAGIPHFPPSKIRQRVEALAAYDVGLLRKLSLTWPPPNEVPEYPNFAYGVWFAGLRHVTLHHEEPKFRPLKKEYYYTSGKFTGLPLSWEQLIMEEKDKTPHVKSLRALTIRPLTDKTIGRTELEALPIEYLRILRGRFELLDESAREFVSSLLGKLFSFPSYIAAVILEVARELRLSGFHQCKQQVEQRLLELSENQEDPAALVPLFFVTSSYHWTVR